MNKSYDYVAPDYRIRFGMGGDWFWFQDKSFGISGDLNDGDWKLEFCRLDTRYSCVPTPKIMLDDLPYETLVSFRKALGIKGLEWVLDREVTLLKEEE